jgi:spermidine synthase
MRYFFAFFFVSGFCSILYELVWLRLAMAQFAVTTALVSIVLSAFMIGLGVGSWRAGHYIRRRSLPSKVSALRLYALTELLIGLSSVLVPQELIWGRTLLEKFDVTTALPVALYYLAAGLWIGLTLVPWCALMGATFPLAMAAIRANLSDPSTRSFSYLYLANISGAVTGTVIPLLLIESLGVRGTLQIGGLLNLCLAASAFVLSLGRRSLPVVGESTKPAPSIAVSSRWFNYLLFATGFTSMGAEVVWIRLFTPALGTMVYAFAIILGLYLGATYIGSLIYRKGKFRESGPGNFLLASTALAIVLPLLVCDPRLRIINLLRIVGILPFSLIMGFVTPMVLDRISGGDPDRAGTGYAINITGCVLGPLVSGFLLLPLLGERFTLLAFALPWIACSFLGPLGESADLRPRLAPKPVLVGLIALTLVFFTNSFESQYTPRKVRRDSTATVTAFGADRDHKQLLVNGVGMTGLTPITKMMAHLPLAFHAGKPQNVLVICFGMGTTHRSVLSWGIQSTAVELVPSVVAMFPFFHSNAEELLRSPLSHVVIDDGRFYMERSSQFYDVIVIDPPPPVQAAGSSLLYSKEFYSIAKMHLAPGGILQQWFPMYGEDPAIIASVAKALRESFPNIRVFRSIEGWGYHFLASESSLPSPSAAALVSHLPGAAVTDLMEWGPAANAEQQFAGVLNQELSLNGLIAQAPGVPALQDDRPVNEYYILRHVKDPEHRRRVWQRFMARVGGKQITK